VVRVDLRLDSWDSGWLGLGISPEGDVQVPLKTEGRIVRVERRLPFRESGLVWAISLGAVGDWFTVSDGPSLRSEHGHGWRSWLWQEGWVLLHHSKCAQAPALVDCVEFYFADD